MSDFIIMTDTGCDILPEILDEWKVGLIDLIFTDVAADKAYTQREITTDDFYRKMIDGARFKTSAANPDDFYKAFEPHLKDGKDILYVAFSSGLSSTVSTSKLVANDLAEQYPDRKIICFDTLCASAGHGFMVYRAVRKRDEGCTIEEIVDYLSTIRPGLCHWFTVGDLEYLKRGGRCSPAAAFMGAVLNIKPVLHVDDEGHLIAMFKVRGRKKSIDAVAEKYFELVDPKYGDEYFISHGYCREDALALEKIVEGKTGKKATLITDIGPVIGSHSGPGTLAIFFVGKNR
ncbi:MAG: DegV family protein [Parasporobacterium sp.]|nr:DegV family protein [Parasporobacterium sp.]